MTKRPGLNILPVAQEVSKFQANMKSREDDGGNFAWGSEIVCSAVNKIFKWNITLAEACFSKNHFI